MNKDDVFAALDRLENDALASRDGYGDARKDAEIIRAALTAKQAPAPKAVEDFPEFITADLELLMKDLNSFNLSAMKDKKTHWQDGGEFEDRVFEAARLYFMSRIKTPTPPNVTKQLVEALVKLKPYLDRSMKRLEERKRRTRIASLESHDFYCAMYYAIEALAAAVKEGFSHG